MSKRNSESAVDDGRVGERGDGLLDQLLGRLVRARADEFGRDRAQERFVVSRERVAAPGGPIVWSHKWGIVAAAASNGSAPASHGRPRSNSCKERTAITFDARACLICSLVAHSRTKRSFKPYAIYASERSLSPQNIPKNRRREDCTCTVKPQEQ